MVEFFISKDEDPALRLIWMDPLTLNLKKLDTNPALNWGEVPDQDQDKKAASIFFSI